MGRNSTSGVLTIPASAVVPEKLHGNKKCDKEEEEQHFFGLLKLLFATFLISTGWPQKVVHFSTHHIFGTVQDKMKQISQKYY